MLLPAGEVAEWSKAHAWKVCIRQRIEGSNPSLSAILLIKTSSYVDLLPWLNLNTNLKQRATVRGNQIRPNGLIEGF